MMFLGSGYGNIFPEKFTCKVVLSAGSFDSFIQPEKNDTLNIDLKNLEAWKDRIAFEEGSYISLHNMSGGNLSISKINHSSHDPGGIEISNNKTTSRRLSLRIMGDANASTFTGWIVDDNQVDASYKTASMLAMSCLKI